MHVRAVPLRSCPRYPRPKKGTLLGARREKGAPVNAPTRSGAPSSSTGEDPRPPGQARCIVWKYACTASDGDRAVLLYRVRLHNEVPSAEFAE
jgi:hypothetical protein